MVKLIYAGSNSKISNAVNRANEILRNDAFYSAISKLPQMDNTLMTSQSISDTIKSADHNIQIQTWRNRFSRANASTGSSHVIRLNIPKISESIPRAVNTIIHETVHAIDFLDDKLDFTHFDNDPDGEINTAPWRIGAIAQELAG